MTSPIVRDWMTMDPISCQRGVSVASARAQMEREEVQRLLIVDGEDFLLGLLSWTDIMRVWPSPFTALEPLEVRELMARVAVDEVMSTEVVAIDPDATISEAVNLMFENRIGALPVLAKGRVLGIFTNSDIRQGLVRVLTERRTSDQR